MVFLNITDNMSTSEIAASVTICGLVIVFFMLVLLVFVIWLFGFVMSLGKQKKTDINKPKTVVKEKKGTAVVSENVSDEVSAEVVAVISAAVAAIYDGSCKRPVIRSISPSAKPQRPVWSAAGIVQNTQSF